MPFSRIHKKAMIPMDIDLDDLRFGLYGPGKVLVDSGFFRLCQRGHSWDWYYVPTSELWALFSHRPDLEALLPALYQFVFAEAMEVCTLDASARREWAEQHLQAMGMTEDGLDHLRLLVRHYTRPNALSLAWQAGAVT